MNRRGYKKWIVVCIHAAAWILFFSLPYLLRPAYNPGDKHSSQDYTTAGFIVARISDLLLIGFFYFNAGVLIVRLFYKKKYWLYALSVIACSIVFSYITGLLQMYLSAQGASFSLRLHFFFSTFIFLFILAFSTAYQTIRDNIIMDNLSKERINENLTTELSLLRSQVSPHFMFNVLNNMVALARKQSDLLEPSLIKLSSLMRYMLYETGEQKVSLIKEIEYLQSFIDLQRMRFGKKLQVNISIIPGDDYYEIEPMLLIPFVENAFKHGTGMIAAPQIDIDLHTAGSTLHLTVTNKYDPASAEIKDYASGIGLANVKRRLELLYPGEHVLTVTKNGHTFSVLLQINLGQ